MIANRDGGGPPQSWNRPGARRAPRRLSTGEATLDATMERTCDWLLDRQEYEGYWVAELEGDTILESEYILLMTFLGREADDVCVRCARYIEGHQLPEGGWSIYPGGPADISASVKAYFALKLTGRAPDEPEMARRGGRSSNWAARTPATASAASTWRCWARSTMTNAHACPPSWC